MIDAINPVRQINSSPDPIAIERGVSQSPKLNQPVNRDAITFSKHLGERLTRRKLELSDDKLNRLSAAVDRVAQKGARESVVLLDDMALLVNVKNRVVLTAIETQKMKTGVFTNIDSMVVG